MHTAHHPRGVCGTFTPMCYITIGFLLSSVYFAFLFIVLPLLLKRA